MAEGDRYFTPYRNVSPIQRTDLQAKARSMFTLSDVLGRVGGAFQQQLTNEAVVWAQREGGKQGGLDTKKVTVITGGKPKEVAIPQLTRAPGAGRVAQAYNQSAEMAYGLRMDAMTQGELTRIEAENYDDPVAMTSAIAEFSAGVKQTMPPELIAGYDQQIMQLSAPMLVSAQKRALDRRTEQMKAAFSTYQSSLIGMMVANASREGAAGIVGSTVNADAFQGFVDMLVNTAKANPGVFSIEEAMATVDTTLRTAAPEMVMAQFHSSANREAWLAKFLSGEVTVSIPHVDWQTGEVTAGLYDAVSASSLVGDKMQGVLNAMQADVRAQQAEDRAARTEWRANQTILKGQALLQFYANPSSETFQTLAQFEDGDLVKNASQWWQNNGSLGVPPSMVDNVKSEIINDGERYTEADLIARGLSRPQAEDVMKAQTARDDILTQPAFQTATRYLDTVIAGVTPGTTVLKVPGQASAEDDLKDQTVKVIRGKLLERAIDLNGEGYQMVQDPSLIQNDEKKQFSPYALVREIETKATEKTKALTSQIDVIRKNVADIQVKQQQLQEKAQKEELSEIELQQQNTLISTKRNMQAQLKQLQAQAERALLDVAEAY